MSCDSVVSLIADPAYGVSATCRCGWFVNADLVIGLASVLDHLHGGALPAVSAVDPSDPFWRAPV